jgi:pentatricopeptide repeat-containing protein PET309
MLHSAFWSHGAAEISPPSWWSLFLATTRDTFAPYAKDRTRRSSSGDPSYWLFLDFLYPSQALESLPRGSSYGAHVLLNRRRRLVARSGSRSYTSTSEGIAEHEERAPQILASEPVLQSFDKASKYPRELLKHILKERGQKPTDFDDAWHAYHRLRTPGAYTSRLIAFLSYSLRDVDQERIVSLVATLPAARRGKIGFRWIMEAFTRLGDIATAYLRLCKALAKADTSLHSTSLLASSINSQEWLFAAQLFKEYEADNLGILNWADIDRLPQLMEHLSNLLEFMEQNSKNMESSTYQDLQKLASPLALRVLKQRRFMGEVSEIEITSVFTALRSTNVLSKAHYTSAIHSLLATNREIGIAESLYRELSTTSVFGRPTKSMLGSFLGAFCKSQSQPGIHRTLEDFKTYYGGPDERAYHLLLTTYARSGDEMKVNQAFSEYCSRFGTPTDLDFLTPLIYVHARVGDVRKAIGEFNRIKGKFNVEPDIVCWNIIIAAHARAGDVVGAFARYKEATEEGLEPDAYTFGTLMGMLANRGDTEGVQRLLDTAKEKNVKLTTALIDPQVEALCHNGDVYEAIDLLKSAVHMDLIGSRTRMWNILLVTFASQKDVYRTMETQNHMKSFGIPFDEMTYAGLMGCLTRIGRTDAALKMLVEVMPRKGFLGKPFHYSLVLQGFAREGNRDMVAVVHRKMLELFNKTNFSANLSLLSTAIKRDLKNIGDSPIEVTKLELPHAESFLELTMKNWSIDTLASKDPQPGTYGQLATEAYPSAYFDQIIVALGTRGASKKVEALFDEYLRLRGDLPAGDGSKVPAIRLLSALMVSHLHQGEYAEVAALWKMALPKAVQLARRFNVSSIVGARPPPPTPDMPSMLLSAKKPKAPLSESDNDILRSQAFILANPLKHYMNSLAVQGLYDNISTTISSFQRAGFVLSTKNWNNYIQILATSPNPDDQLGAFVLCESLLMPNFPLHWRMMTAGYGTDPFKRDKWWTKKSEKRVDQNYYPGHLQPTYLTMVCLGAAFIKFRDRAAVEGGEEMGRLRKQAPKTTEALIVMPRLKDRTQEILLRGRDPTEVKDTPPRRKIAYIKRRITSRRVIDTGSGRLREARRWRNARRTFG